MTRHKHRRIKLRSMYQWHRYIGVAISLLVIHLSVTGIMLNHTEQLGLAKSHTASAWLLDWYGIRVPEKVISYQAGNNWLSQWEQQLFFNEKTLGKYPEQLQGVIMLQHFMVIALNSKLLLVSYKGELIEQLGSEHGMPTGITAIGSTDADKLVIKTANGAYTTDAELLSWKTVPEQSMRWSAPAQLPNARYQQLKQRYRGKGLTLERITQDLHSGRILGLKGVYFTDIIAILLLCLAGSGLWLWTMRSVRNRQRGRKNPAKHGDV